ncbi:MAG: hypothetical protein JWQ44_200, partial [Chthoniobacter sp.]|nr:hypothetical protein [Chthoniobacter sp.]
MRTVFAALLAFLPLASAVEPWADEKLPV